MTEKEENVQLDRTEDEVDLFSGLILYLVVLEQLGTIFINKNTNGRQIVRNLTSQAKGESGNNSKLSNFFKRNSN